MLDDKDISKIGEMMDARMDARFEAQDRRIEARFAEQDRKIETHLLAQDQKINGLRDGVIDLIARAIIPQLEELNVRSERIETRLDDFADRVDRKFDTLVTVLTEERVIPRSATALLNRVRVA